MPGELRSIVGKQVFRRPTVLNQPVQNLDDMLATQPLPDFDRQALPAELVDHRQHADWPAIVGPCCHEVVGPDVVGPVRPQPQDRPVIEPQAAPFWLPFRYLQPLAPPDPLHPLGVDPPAVPSKQCRDPPVAVAAVLRRQGDDVGGQRSLVTADPRQLALGGPGLPDRLASPALGDAQFCLHMTDTVAAARRA